MSIKAFDHVALPIENVDEMLSFYRRLGFEVKEFEYEGARFYSVHFGEHRINFHDPATWRSESFTLKGLAALPGCGDLCFVWDRTEEALLNFVSTLWMEVLEGPIEMTGGRAYGGVNGKSVYVRDPDSNLLEFIFLSLK